MNYVTATNPVLEKRRKEYAKIGTRGQEVLDLRDSGSPEWVEEAHEYCAHMSGLSPDRERAPASSDDELQERWIEGETHSSARFFYWLKTLGHAGPLTNEELADLVDVLASHERNYAEELIGFLKKERDDYLPAANSYLCGIGVGAGSDVPTGLVAGVTYDQVRSLAQVVAKNIGVDDDLTFYVYTRILYAIVNIRDNGTYKPVSRRRTPASVMLSTEKSIRYYVDLIEQDFGEKVEIEEAPSRYRNEGLVYTLRSFGEPIFVSSDRRSISRFLNKYYASLTQVGNQLLVGQR